MTARCCQSWSFVGAKMQVKVSIGSCARWVTFAWRLMPSMLRVCAHGLSCRTAEARGNSTVAVLGQVADVPARAVHRPGVDVLVSMQRRGCLALGEGVEGLEDELSTQVVSSS